MRYVGTATACGLLASSSLVHAFEIPGEFSGTVSYSTDYYWAGYTNSGGDGSWTATFDWWSGAHWYGDIYVVTGVDYYESDESVFTTTVGPGPDLMDSTDDKKRRIDSDDGVDMEIDFYAGYWGYIGGGYNTPYDIGLAYYYYPGARGDITYRGYSTTVMDGPVENSTRLYTTGSYFDFYAGIGHYFFDDRVFVMAYQTYTNDYNGQNEDAFSTYFDAEIYMPHGLTMTIHGGYNYGGYWRHNLWGFSTNNPGGYGWCGYTWAKEDDPSNMADSGRSASCIDARHSDSDYFDWGIGLKKSFGDFELSAQYVWVTGIEHEEMVKKWWSGWDEEGPNEFYTDGKWIGKVKYSW